jgi:hypothetical protein
MQLHPLGADCRKTSGEMDKVVPLRIVSAKFRLANGR